MKATIEFDNFDNRVKEIVRNVLQEELMKIRATLIPLISAQEQEDIEELYGKPSNEVDRIIDTNL